MLHGLHPRWERCTLVAIKFDPKVGAYVELTGEHGEPIIVSAECAFLGQTLTEIRRLRRGLRLIHGALEDKLRASVTSLESRNGGKAGA